MGPVMAHNDTWAWQVRGLRLSGYAGHHYRIEGRHWQGLRRALVGPAQVAAGSSGVGG